MSIQIPGSEQLIPEAFVDSALLHGAVSVFYRQPTLMTEWEAYSLAMMTLGLWFHRGLRIQAGIYEGTSVFDSALVALGAVRAQPSHSNDYAECVRRMNDWATGNVSDIRNAVEKMQADLSYPDWIGWCVENAWDEHRRRHGGLVDASMLEPLRLVMDLPSVQSAQQLIADAQNAMYVNQWVAEGAERAPEEVIKGYVVSALLRGVVNHELRCRDGSQYAFHPFRRHIIPPGRASHETELPDTARWLASMILNSAFQLHDPRERAVCWAQNVARVRLAVIDPERPLTIDPTLVETRAATRAAQIVKELDLMMPSRVIGAGVDVLLGFVEKIALYDYVAKFWGWETPSDMVVAKLTKSSRHLTDIGRQRPGQIVFLKSSLAIAPTRPAE